jgi:hypothetical protein
MERPPVKITTTERAHEQRTQAPHPGGEGGDSQAALDDRIPISTLCDEHQLHPTVFYRWLKQFFDNGVAAFGPAPRLDKQVWSVNALLGSWPVCSLPGGQLIHTLA